jgi:opacity protein-like surface antigen
MAASSFRFKGVLALLCALVSTAAAAQTLGPSYAGDCAVAVTLAGQRTGDVVQVQVAFGSLQSRALESDGLKDVTVSTGAALQKGDTLRLLINGSEVAGARITTEDVAKRPAERKPLGKCPNPKTTPAFAGDSFEASAYLGWAFDQFAPDSIGGYPANTVTEKHNRYLFGVNFDYRMLGSDTSKMQFWLAGETLHGVRSADVNCDAETNKPVV